MSARVGPSAPGALARAVRAVAQAAVAQIAVAQIAVAQAAVAQVAVAQVAVAALAVSALGPFALGCGGALHAGPPSDHFDGARFHNVPEVEQPSVPGILAWFTTREVKDWPFLASPPAPPPPPRVDDGTVRVTFVGHSTLLVQAAGVNLLTDPVYSEQVGPTSWLGPRRHHAPGVRWEDLPRVDVVVVSHDHYDHMDYPTLARLAERDAPTFVVGLGNRARLRQAGVTEKVVELDWWQCTPVDGVRVCAVPVQHNSRRNFTDGDRTLWTGFHLATRAGAVYFAGDTGYGGHFRAARARLGAPCVALLPIGAYMPRDFMRPNHVDPAEAVRAHDELGARASVAMHWATFQQSDEAILQPRAELERALGEGSHAPFHAPWFGEAVTVRCN